MTFQKIVACFMLVLLVCEFQGPVRVLANCGVRLAIYRKVTCHHKNRREVQTRVVERKFQLNYLSPTR